jgi:PhnB protein
MQVSIHLSFKGNCEAAFKFYERALGGKILFKMTYGESPMAEQTPADWRNKIMHATVAFGDMTLMGADAPPDRQEERKGFAVTVAVKDPAEADRIFKALSENATVQMPIQQTFWSPRFGMLVDQFGIPWMVNCEQAQ